MRGGKIKVLCLWALLAILLVPGWAYSLEARVQRVIDGRTVVLSNGERVRYIGVEIPNDVQSVTEATNLNRDLVAGADVRLEFDRQLRDKDGSLLAYVYIGDLMVNEYLIQTGRARVESYSINRRFLTKMLRLQARASNDRLGIWARVAGEPSAIPETEKEVSEEEWQIEGEELPAGWEEELVPSAPEVTEELAVPSAPEVTEETIPSPEAPEGELEVIEPQ